MALSWDQTGAQELLGYSVDLQPDARRAECRLMVGSQHLNRQNILHGGFAATLLDTAMGATAGLPGQDGRLDRVSTVSLNVTFVAPGQPGLVVATGRIVGGGRKLIFVDGELCHQDGTVIARATGVFKKHGKATP